MVLFRRSLSLPQSQVLTEIQEGLYPRSCSSHRLVHAHLAAVAERRREADAEAAGDVEPQGRLEMRSGGKEIWCFSYSRTRL